MADSDLLVIGAGPGGYVAAIRAAQLGLKVILVEREKAGGTCLHRGCIPSKLYLHGAQLLEAIQQAGDFGVRVPGPPSLDFAALAGRKDRTVAQLEKGIEFLLSKRGVQLLRGDAAFVDPHTVNLRGANGQSRTLSFHSGIVATGSVPSQLPGFPRDESTFVTSDEVFRWTSLPGSILIVGAGVIGCEFASCFARLGVPVQMVELLEQVLPGFDEEVRREVGRGLKKQKVELHLGVKVEEAGYGPAGARVTLSTGDSLSAQVCIVAVGRRPNTEGLGLERAGLVLNAKGALAVDSHCRTEVGHLYAIGDVTGVAPLAHVASHMGIVAAEQAAGVARGGKDPTFDPSLVPWGVFCKPEAGFIGLTEEKARASGRALKIGRFPFRALGKAQAIGEVDGLVKVIADAQDGRLLGLHIVGPAATELLGEGSLAWQTEAQVEDLAQAIHGHPTLGEALGEAALAALGRGIHSV